MKKLCPRHDLKNSIRSFFSQNCFWNLILLFMFLLSSSCSSSKKKKLKETNHSKTLQKDYVVRDASSDIRPGWIEDAQVWATQEGLNTKKYRYFSFETDPKVSREMACELAKAKARVDIASEITTFIEKSLATNSEGQAALNENNPEMKSLRSYLASQLSEKIQSMLHGVSVVKTYWEKRNFLIKLGAVKNYFGFTCASLVRIEEDQLKHAIQKASENLKSKADPEMKDKVEKSLEKLEENFIKARQGTI